jgi:hypothetical protein
MSKIIDRFVQLSTGKELDETTCNVIRTHMKHKKIPTEFSEDDDAVNIWMDIKNILLSETNSKHTVKQLKYLLRNLGATLSGSKSELLARLKAYVIVNCNAMTIQRIYRGWVMNRAYVLFNKYENTRNKCVNDTDFYNLDKLNDIPKFKFITVTDEHNHSYGFSLNSLYTLSKQPPMKNPYNRLPISDIVSKHLSWIYNLGHFKRINEDTDNVTSKMNINELYTLKVVSLFQHINSLGNYSNPTWFLELSLVKIQQFFKYLRDIWYYRAGIDVVTRRNICPSADPFTVRINESLLYALDNINYETYVKLQVLNVMHLMVFTGVNDDSKSLGSLYVLSALTLVSDVAASAFPWLYESVYEGNY